MKKVFPALCAVLLSASLFTGIGALAADKTTSPIMNGSAIRLDYDDYDDDDYYDDHYDDDYYENYSAPSWSNGFSPSKVISQLEVKEYLYTDANNVSWFFLAVKNGSDYTLDLEAAVRFYNAAGKVIAVDDEGQDEFEKGNQTILVFRLREAPASYKYTWQVEPEHEVDFPLSHLSYKAVKGVGKETVTVTNNSRRSTDDIDGTIIFLKDDKIVGFDTVRFLKSHEVLKPGKSVSQSFLCDVSYDSTILAIDAD